MKFEQKYQKFDWIRIKRYELDESKSWQDRYADLEEHHHKETAFLIAEIRKLARLLDKNSSIEEEEQKSQ